MALVRDNGDTRIYFSRNGGPLTVYDFGNSVSPNPISGVDTFSIGDPYLPVQDHLPFKGSIDEIRLSAFAPGTFSTGDLLFSTPIPEPSTLVLGVISVASIMLYRCRRRNEFLL
jgi:hypothetical protein